MTNEQRVAWTIVDRRTNRPVTIVSFLSREGAESQITQWQNRHDRGGRKDITREALLNMEPKRVADALPWGSRRDTDKHAEI
jgi:hypothetical protein